MSPALIYSVIIFHIFAIGLLFQSQAFSIPMSRTIKGRIAERLGLSKPPPGRTIPMQRRPGERAVDVRRGDSGTTPLSILGDRDELIEFQEWVLNL